MSTSSTRLATWLVRAWVRTYTLGLPPDLRDARREEVESDLWEMAEEARLCGWESAESLCQLTLRLILGVPADLSWRIQHVGAKSRTNQQLEETARVSTSASVKALLVATLLLGAFSAAVGVWNVLGDDSDNYAVQEIGRLGAGIPFLGLTILIVSGFLAQARSVILGTGLLVVGAVAIALMSWWVLLTPVLAMLVVVLGLQRASSLTTGRTGPGSGGRSGNGGL